MNKKVLYLGGYFQAEHSMKRSFADAGVEMLFLIDDNEYTKDGFWTNSAYHNYKDKSVIKVVPSSELEDFVEQYRPDVIIHRHYLYKPIMHSNSWEIAKTFGIPFVHLEMELSPNIEENKDLKNLYTLCDVFLYAHDFETIPLKFMKENKKACYFYPYGVSSFERSIPEITKDREIGGFGVLRVDERERCHSLNVFLEGIKKLGKKMHIYGSWKFSPWIDFSSLIIHPEYKWEEATEVMNRHKIAINFETLPNLEGAYSHKMFQTIGCGAVTLTTYKKSINKLFFGVQNPVFVENSKDVSRWVEHFLSKEEDRVYISEQGERFIHERFDWFRRFDDIMKKEKIW